MSDKSTDHSTHTELKSAPAKRRSGERNISPEGRAAMAAAGRASLPALMRANSLASQADNQAIAKKAAALVAEAVSELGGEANLKARHRHLLVAQELLLFTVLAGSEALQRKGIANRHGKPRALLSVLASYVNSLRLNLQALGLSDEIDEDAKLNEEFARIEAEIVAARTPKNENSDS